MRFRDLKDEQRNSRQLHYLVRGVWEPAWGTAFSWALLSSYKHISLLLNNSTVFLGLFLYFIFCTFDLFLCSYLLLSSTNYNKQLNWLWTLDSFPTLPHKNTPSNPAHGDTHLQTDSRCNTFLVNYCNLSISVLPVSRLSSCSSSTTSPAILPSTEATLMSHLGDVSKEVGPSAHMPYGFHPQIRQQWNWEKWLPTFLMQF